MAIIVYGDESRPFCFKDFLRFELDGLQYTYTHGTIRNTFSLLKKQQKIEKAYKSIPTFYTLKGVKFGKPITPGHREGSFNIHKGTCSITLEHYQSKIRTRGS